MAIESGGIGRLNYQEEITASSLTIIFDGIEYTVERDSEGGYGNESITQGPAFGTPFYIIRRKTIENNEFVNYVYTATSGEHTIKIIARESVETTECFEKAVSSVVEDMLPMECIDGVTTLAEMADAVTKHRLMYFMYNGEYYMVSNFNPTDVSFFPENSKIATSLNEAGVFTIS